MGEARLCSQSKEGFWVEITKNAIKSSSPAAMQGIFYYFRLMKTRLIIFGSLAALFFFILRVQGANLITDATPLGIINLEFASTAEELNAVLFGWSNADVKANIYIDFVFIPFYVLFFSTAALACSKAWKSISMQHAGKSLSKAAYVAGALDLVENKFMLDSFAGSFSDFTLMLTNWCAGAKFLLLLVVILYIVISLPFISSIKTNNGSQSLEN